jgi:cardiolipin synthase (CMP-forming)
MTTANKITILRILLTPFFVVEGLYYVTTGNEVYRFIAIISFAVAAICDGVDGYVARRYNQRSELGAILDPLADKLLLVSAIVLLSFNWTYFERIPLWLTCTILGRDILILVGVVVIQITIGKLRVKPRVFGKIATVLQMVTVIWVLLKWDEKQLHYCALAAAIFTGASGLLYVWDGVRQLSSHPASNPKSGKSPDGTTDPKNASND